MMNDFDCRLVSIAWRGSSLDVAKGQEDYYSNCDRKSGGRSQQLLLLPVSSPC